jgi:immune inhibitor A
MHELQHLVHHARNPYSDAWLTEGLSEVASESVSGSATYLRSYQNAPGTQLIDWSANGNTAPHYGAAHSFLRYLLRHYGGIDRAKDLAAQGGFGVNAVQKYLRAGGFGVGFEDVFADWLVAGYLDLPGEGRFSNPGAESRVRAVTRLSDPQAGSGVPGQFGADFFEIDPRGKDAVFRFRGSTTVKQIPNEAANGKGQWWSGRGDSLDATLTRELDLRSVRSATLRFKTWYEIERGFDYAYVAASTDGGASWTVLRGRHAAEFDPLGYAHGPGFTGISGNGDRPAWVDEEIDLSAFAGRVVLLRFEYVTDEASTTAGFAIDDVAVPELGFADDAEQDSGWQASGFRRVSGPLPQRYLVQFVYEDLGGWKSRSVEVAPDGTAEVRVRGALKRAGIIVAGLTYDTNLPASYQWEYAPGGG